MRRPAAHAVQAALLAGPTVLAFFDGGYFTGPRLGALVVTYVLLAGAALTSRHRSGPFLTRAGAAAVGGLLLLAVWTSLSASWAPVEVAAVDARERAFLYLGAVVAAALAFRDRAAAAWVEPALAGGVVVAIGYGLLDQLALVDLADSAAAGGRLYHPLTYWNAEGALAAIGLVLAARLAGTRSRPLALRLAAAAAGPLLGLGVYLTFSRGSLTALGVGLAVLLALTPTWTQLRSVAIAVEASALAAGAFELLPRDVVVVPLLALMLLAAATQAWSAQAEDREAARLGPLPAPWRARGTAWTAAALLALAPFAAAAIDRDDGARDPAFGATPDRLSSAGSDRFGYWEVALETFAEDPAVGAGAGAFSTSGSPAATPTRPSATPIRCSSRRPPSSAWSAWPSSCSPSAA
jgi:hypothetical protein